MSLMVVMVIVMRTNTITTDIMRMRKSIILPVGASKYKVHHGDADSRTQEDLLLYTRILHATNGSNLIHFVSCNVTNP